MEDVGPFSCVTFAVTESRGIESRLFLMMGPIAFCSQMVRNDVVKRTNVHIAEEGGDNCRTMFLTRGRSWIQCTKGRFGLGWRANRHPC